MQIKFIAGAAATLLLLVACSTPFSSKAVASPTANPHKCADILMKSWVTSTPDPFIPGCVSQHLKDIFKANGFVIDETFMVGAKLYNGEMKFLQQDGNMVVYLVQLVPRLPITQMIMTVWLDDQGLILDYGYAAPLNI